MSAVERPFLITVRKVEAPTDPLRGNTLTEAEFYAALPVLSAAENQSHLFYDQPFSSKITSEPPIEEQKSKRTRKKGRKETPEEKRERMQQTMRAKWQDQGFRDDMTTKLQGHETTDATKQLLSDAQKGKPKSEEAKRNMSLEQGGIKVYALPLLLRGVSVQEVVAITGFDRLQVETLVNHSRQQGLLPRNTPEQIRQAKSNGMKMRKALDANGGVYPEDMQKGFALVKKLLMKGYITEDLTLRNRLIALYETQNRRFPDNTIDQIILEASLATFYGPRRRIRKLKREINRVDQIWYANQIGVENNFVRASQSPQLKHQYITYSPVGDVDWEQTFMILQPEIKQMLRARGVSDTFIEDLSQDVCIKIYTRFATYDPTKGSMRSWIEQMTTNTYFDSYRRRRRRVTLNEHDYNAANHIGNEDIEKSTIDRFIVGEIHSLLRSLPERQRIIMHLRYELDKQYGEIAQILGLPLGTVKKTLFMAHRNLRRQAANLR